MTHHIAPAKDRRPEPAMQRVEIGRIRVGDIWTSKKTGKLVRVNDIIKDGATLQDRIVFADEDGHAGCESVLKFWNTHQPHAATDDTAEQENTAAPLPALETEPPAEPPSVPTKVAGKHSKGSGV